MLWERPPEEKGLRGGDIREGMARGEPWEIMVPAAVAERMYGWDIPARLRKLLRAEKG